MHPIPNIPDHLTRAIYANLCSYLPKPSPDTPENRADRDQRAMLAVAHYLPDNAAEAELAVQIVAADFHAKDAMLSAAEAGGDPEKQRQSRAQVASMMRGMQAGIRTLQKMQAIREKAEAERYPPAMERAGYWFKDVSVPAPPPPQPAAAPPPRTFEQMDPPEQYASLYPDRAAQIRAHGGVPPNATWGPPDDDTARAIVASNSPILRALDPPAISRNATSGPGKTLRDIDEMPPPDHGENQMRAGHAPDRVTSRATARMVW